MDTYQLATQQCQVCLFWFKYIRLLKNMHLNEITERCEQKIPNEIETTI